MTTHSDHQDHWIDGSLEERVLVLAVLALVAISPFLLWVW